MIRKLRLFQLLYPLFLLILTSSALAQAVLPTKAADRLNGLGKKRLLEYKSLAQDVKFRNIGPTIMSGRVTDVEANPEDPTEFYVAYASGGLWYTRNNGQSFSSIFDSEEVMTIGDIAVFWGKTRTIWVGTGEVNSSRSSYSGIGVYKSSNNGQSWDYLGLPESHHIGKIQLHPTNANIAWVAVLGHLYSGNKERGVYKTTDGGRVWRQTLNINENTGVADLDLNPQNPNEMYAAAWHRSRRAWNFEESGPGSGIYKSTDGGDNWKLISAEGSGFPHGAGAGRIGIAVSPSQPQVIYAVIDNNKHKPAAAKTDSSYQVRDFEKISKADFLSLDNKKLDSFLKKNGMTPRYSAKSIKEMVQTDKVKPNAIFDYLFNANEALFNTPIIGCEVYRSNNGGQSWTKTNEKDIPIYNTYGYYFGKIYVSPYNENKVYILGFYAQMSTDGGKTFTTIDKENVHPDHHALWINPKRDSHLINGNDGGCNITYDNGEHWFKANTPAVGQFYAIAVDNARPYNVYGGLQDNGTWYGPSTHKENTDWHENGQYGFKGIGGGDGMQVQVDTRDNRTVYTGFQFGFYSRGNTAERGGGKSIHPQHELGERPLRFNWQTPIWLSRHNQDVFYYGSNRFHRSLNKAETLEALSPDLTNGGIAGNVPFGTLTTIHESPLKFGLLYAGTDDGNIHLSKDGGYTWTKISSKLPQGLWVSRVIASQHKEGRVYATLNGYRFDNFAPYVYMSEDFGANWKAIAKELPMEPVNVIREDPKQDSLIYIGTDGGLYISLDGGNNMMAMTNGLPRSVAVHDIAIQQRENEIVLGTHGRSIYIAKLDSVQLLMTDTQLRAKKTAEAGRLLSLANGENSNLLWKRKIGEEIECPPVKN